VLEISIITIHPRTVQSYLEVGVIRAAISKGSLKVNVINLRDYAIDNRGTIDDRPYGGGDGMILRPEPLARAIDALGAIPRRVINFSPAGKRFTDSDALRLASSSEHLVMVCGRFEGIDQRFLDLYCNEEISIGDFILSGGELPALVVTDSITRKLPGALGNPASVINESFSTELGGRLEGPVYTRPPMFENLGVPPVLLSGDHQEIRKWQEEQSLLRTKKNRPDLLD
jgi:tRNA (guanine37-N1)-methyltransferase